MKVFSRIIVLNIIVNFIVGFFINPFSVSIGEIQTAKEWLLFIWGGFTVVGGLIWWLYMFWHWAMSGFKNKTIKKIWLLVLFLGTMLFLIGPISYYVIVIEKGKSLIGKTKETESEIIT